MEKESQKAPEWPCPICRKPIPLKEPLRSRRPQKVYCPSCKVTVTIRPRYQIRRQ